MHFTESQTNPFSLIVLDRRKLQDSFPKDADKKQINKICREQLQLEICKYLLEYYSQFLPSANSKLSLDNISNLFEFDKTENGKPFIKARQAIDDSVQNPIINFNISHSNDLYVCAFSEKNIGIDIEYLKKKRKFIDLAKEYFFENEIKYLLAIDGEQPERFYRLWTLKEATLKAFGGKLADDLCNINVDFSDLNKPIIKYIGEHMATSCNDSFNANVVYLADGEYICSLVEYDT